MQEAASAHLLQHQISEQDVPEDLEEGLDRGPDHDFQHLIDVQPEAVIRCAARCSALNAEYRLDKVQLQHHSHSPCCL